MGSDNDFLIATALLTVFVGVWLGVAIHRARRDAPNPAGVGFLVALFVVVPAVTVVQWLFTAVNDAQSMPTLSLASTSVGGADADLVNAAAVQLRAACPGLDKHAADLQVARAEATSSCAVKFEIVVANSAESVPAHYYAAGHHCYFDVGLWPPAGVSVMKDPCIALCLDQGALPDDIEPFFVAQAVPPQVRLPACVNSAPTFLDAAATPPQVDLLVDRIDASVLTKGLDLYDEEVARSDNGRVRHRWRLGSSEYADFEIIGNDQGDADVVAWGCSEYDEQGGALFAAREESMCRTLLIQVLANVVVNASEVGNYLVARAVRFQPRPAWIDSGDFRFEADGHSYFIWRRERMLKSHRKPVLG